jgi:hypothetical protein
LREIKEENEATEVDLQYTKAINFDEPRNPIIASNLTDTLKSESTKEETKGDGISSFL